MKKPPINKQIVVKSNLPFITSANTWLDKITEANVKMNMEPREYLNQYFQLIYAFAKKHHAQISSKNKIILKLRKIRTALYNPQFRKDWKKAQNLSEVNRNVLKIIDAIDDVLILIIEDLAIAGITSEKIENE